MNKQAQTHKHNENNKSEKTKKLYITFISQYSLEDQDGINTFYKGWIGLHNMG